MSSRRALSEQGVEVCGRKFELLAVKTDHNIRDIKVRRDACSSTHTSNNTHTHTSTRTRTRTSRGALTRSTSTLYFYSYLTSTPTSLLLLPYSYVYYLNLRLTSSGLLCRHGRRRRHASLHAQRAAPAVAYRIRCARLICCV